MQLCIADCTDISLQVLATEGMGVCVSSASVQWHSAVPEFIPFQQNYLTDADCNVQGTH